MARAKFKPGTLVKFDQSGSIETVGDIRFAEIESVTTHKDGTYSYGLEGGGTVREDEVLQSYRPTVERTAKKKAKNTETTRKPKGMKKGPYANDEAQAPEAH